jgi:FAD/FMN-containing dehydrogenase/Fe-S oxidoreductase
MQTGSPIPAPPSAAAVAAVVAAIRSETSADVRTDRLARGLYATDASIYEIIPDAVVCPRSVADVQAVVRSCAAHGLPVTPRGAGTGLAGNCLNRGIQLDLSRHLNSIISIDPAGRAARVQAGVVLDELNAALQPHGLHFPPDVATANRATIGGMIGNNSAGAHSMAVGRTCDHVLGVEVVLSDGSLACWGAGDNNADNALAQRCEDVLAEISRDYADEIAARFPRVFRCNGAYALDRLRRPDGRLDPTQVIVGSEGTLCVVVAATLNLTPRPRHQGLCLVHFDELRPALRAVPAILQHNPAAVELLDRLILERAQRNPSTRARRHVLTGDPAALLIVELYDDDGENLQRRLQTLAAELESASIGYARPILTDAAHQADVWAIRKAGTGLVLSQPGDTQPHDFIEDCAVDPARLADYIARLQQILADEGIPQAAFYGHASVGLLHVRPALNLKTADGVRKLRRISERTSQLVREFGGAMTGEHGEGLSRSEWVARLFGPRLTQAFHTVKNAFDPQGIFNPGKIVNPLPMDANLRYGVGFTSTQPATMLDFSTHGGPAGLADMCSGIGECRQRLAGTMCPSYMATGDETHTTRARANALRLALSNRSLLDGLADPALNEVFDLCLGCKACQTECPTGTDVGKLKAEWLYQRCQRQGVPRRSRFVARTIRLAAWGQKFASLSNWLLHAEPVRALLQYWYGLDRRVPFPPFAAQTFRQWFAAHRPARAASARAAMPVVYFVDTWTNYFTPAVGQATVKVLEALGCAVIVPPTVCCGRPLISTGLLDEAQALARRNVAALAPFAEREIPIIGTEPSCVSVLTDELPQLVRTTAARRIAALATPIDAFVAAALARDPHTLRFAPAAQAAIFHGHCHQKALTGTAAALQLLTACTAGQARELNTGCCGMAGIFGHEHEHYEIARAIGEQRLFPAVRARGAADVVVTGFSCRQHIAHHTGVQARHLIEHVAAALLPDGESAPPSLPRTES